MPHPTLSADSITCIQHCGSCALLCAQAGPHCLLLGGEHASAEHQGLLHDCADICALAVAFMARSSTYAAQLCHLCARVCTACAESCERLAGDDETMKGCAESCRTCAPSCEQMASAAV